MRQTTQEAADILGVSPRTLHKWRRDRIGPRCTLVRGLGYMYEDTDLDEWRHRNAAPLCDPDNPLE